MKKIIVKNKCIGYGIKHIGWSGRGWIDGGPVGAGPLNSRTPSWESYGEEIGINMVRMGLTMNHFLSENEDTVNLDQIKRGLETRDASWAKSEQTSYSYSIQRCKDLGWKILFCINPSYKSSWKPSFITPSSPFLIIWKDFCFYLAKVIEERWPGKAEYFEITNEPDIGYFDGETFLPHYRGPSGGINPFQYSLLLQKASEGLRKAIPSAKIIGPGLASWNKKWIKQVLSQDGSFLDGLSYHNVSGNLRDFDTLREAKELLAEFFPLERHLIINSEWAWWPWHDINNHKTAMRVAQILYQQTTGGAYASLYLGPAQPKDFRKGLGVIQFHPENPNSAERTQTFYAFRLMVRGAKGGKLLEVINPSKTLKILALQKNNKLVITFINPSRKKLRNISLQIDGFIHFKKEHFLKIFQFDYNHPDILIESNFDALKKFSMSPEGITQFILSLV